LFFFARTTTCYRKETILYHFALNICQLIVLSYFVALYLAAGAMIPERKVLHFQAVGGAGYQGVEGGHEEDADEEAGEEAAHDH
jgi:hypothetical protein